MLNIAICIISGGFVFFLQAVAFPKSAIFRFPDYRSIRRR
nr:MAG TPA: hypothetical protein [Caudoviricetes sp.]